MEDKKQILISAKDLGKAFGSLGGNATLKKYGSDHFKKLSVKRWEKKRAENEKQSKEISQ